MEKIKLKMKYLKCLICIKNANPLTKIKKKGYHKDIKEVALNWKTDFQFAKVNTCSWKSL